MDRPRDQLLSGAGLAEDEYRRAGRCDGFHLRERLAEQGALADDLPEGVLGADLALEIETLLSEFLREPRVLLKRNRVGDGQRDLATDGLDDRDRRRREGIGLAVAHGQRAEPAVSHDERDGADRSDARRAQGRGGVGEAIRQVVFAEDERPFRGERLADRGAREAHPDVSLSIAGLGSDRVDHEVAVIFVVQR
jgi:hypothetical protein